MIFICLHWCDFVWLTFSASSYSYIESSLTALVLRVLSFSSPCIPHRQCKVCLQGVLPFIPLFKPLLFVWSTWPLLEPLLETVRHFYSLLTVLELFHPKNVGISRRFCLILAWMPFTDFKNTTHNYFIYSHKSKLDFSFPSIPRMFK